MTHLGPGLIVAGSIVGSGELIATTKTGAEAGFTLLWLILIGCVIKVFVQVEFGRYSIVNGRTTMDGLAEVPGPRIAGRGNWIVWYWFLMFLASIAQLGGIVGGVGQALAISIPLTQQGREFNEYSDAKTELPVLEAVVRRTAERSNDPEAASQLAAKRQQVEQARRRLAAIEDSYRQRLTPEEFARFEKEGPQPGPDVYLWAGALAVATSGILFFGRYGLIQSFSTIMVAAFTLITVANLILLQSNAVWAVTWGDIAEGLRFGLPPRDPNSNATPVGTALATFGIIGVGATELITYPYWCLEKGYARYAGERDDTAAWGARARGWMRVMRWDAWGSMVVYTFATLAFYLLGAAILHRSHLNPEKDQMVRTLAVMYEPVFQSLAATLFLFGAFAVLYSTFFVANASHARVFGDVLRVLGWAKDDPQAYRQRVRWLSALFPLLCFAVFYYYPRPTFLVLLSGVMQGVMLPMLAGAGLYFRYYRSDPRVTPHRHWDLWLWLSAIGMLITGGWTLKMKGGELLEFAAGLMGW